MNNVSQCCFHCLEPLAGSKYVARLTGGDKPVCCIGCQAVAEMIASTGLADFYDRRTSASPKPVGTGSQTAWQAYLQPEVVADFVRRGATTDSVELLIENLRCSACGWLIERTVSTLEGVRIVEVNAVLGRAHVEWSNECSQLEPVMRTIAQLGYVPHPVTADTTTQIYRNERRAMLKRFAVATFGMMQVMMFAVAGYAAELNGETIEKS